MKNKLILDPETGHDRDCLCVGCLAHRGGFTGEEYRAWVRDERTEGKAKLEAFSERHYATRRGEHSVTAEAPTGTSPANPGPSAPQADLIRRLVSERGAEATGITDVEALLPTLTPGKGGSASALISGLLATPRPAQKPRVNTPVPNVPAGRYAIASGGDNDLAFYKVDHGKDGSRWQGYVFVTQLVGGNREYPVKGAAKDTVLGRIAEDTEGASRRYGREYGHCGVCNLPLTDQESRAAGIGPICRAKQGW